MYGGSGLGFFIHGSLLIYFNGKRCFLCSFIFESRYVICSHIVLSLFPFPWRGWWLDQKHGESEMRGVSWGIIVGATIGLVSGALLAVAALLCVRFQKKRARLRNSSSLRAATAPMRTNGVDACAEPSDASTVGQESPIRREADARGLSFWVEESQRRNPVSFSGILKYLYKLVKFSHTPIMDYQISYIIWINQFCNQNKVLVVYS